MTTYKEAKKLAQSRYGPDAAIQEVGGPQGPVCSVFSSEHQQRPVWSGKSWEEFRAFTG